MAEETRVRADLHEHLADVIYCALPEIVRLPVSRQRKRVLDYIQGTAAAHANLSTEIAALRNELDAAQRSSRRLWALVDVLREALDRTASCEHCERYQSGFFEECERSGDAPSECNHVDCEEYGCEIVVQVPAPVAVALCAVGMEDFDGLDIRNAAAASPLPEVEG